MINEDEIWRLLFALCKNVFYCDDTYDYLFGVFVKNDVVSINISLIHRNLYGKCPYCMKAISPENQEKSID